MTPTVTVPRWSLLHLVLTVALLPLPDEPQQRADMERCLTDCVRALDSPAELVDVPLSA